jgi:small subunit ribosomal protein S6
VALRDYEIMLIVDPDSDEAALTGVIDRVSGIITGRGGEVKNVNRWGRRRLTFEINRRAEGQYVVVQFQAESEAVEQLERALHLADEVLRHKIVKRAA